MARRKTVKKKKSNLSFWISLAVFTIALCLVAPISFNIFKKKKQRAKKEQLVLSVPFGFNSIGLDVSHHQGKIDWEMIFDDLGYDTIIHFVYCKATESITHIDTRFKENRTKLNMMGILNGAYHFFDTRFPPREQVVHFLAHWKPREIDLPPMLDVETEGSTDLELVQNMKIWLKEVEKQSGMRPIIYTSLSFYETKFKGKFPGYFFWIAAYTREPDIHNDPQIIHWQFTETGSLPGIREKVDLNVSKQGF
jgi:lysozyme